MTDEVLSAIEADAEAFSNLTTEAGTELSEMIKQTLHLNNAIDKSEQAVKTLKRQRERYLFELIPAKMQEVGMDKVEVDGNSVSLSTYVSGTLPKDPLQRDEAFRHLRDIGCSDFIKNEVTVAFSVTEDNKAKSVQADLEEQGLDTSARTWVEPMTLKKLIRERVENSQDIDLDIFNAHIGTIAKIKGA